MAGTCVQSAPYRDSYQSGGLRELVLAWTSHTDGVVLITENTGGEEITGWVSCMETTPDTTDVPTTYTATLKKGNGAVLATAATRSTTTPEVVDVGFHIFRSTLALVIAGAGSGKKGVCRVIVRVQ